MKGIDIRKIYICQLAEQSKMNSKSQVHPSWRQSNEPKIKPTLNYIGEPKYGLFKKVLHGFGYAYKHLLTDEIYLVAGNSLGGQVVIIPESIEKLTYKETKLCTHLVGKYNSFVMDMSVIGELEEKFNKDVNSAEERE